MTLTIEKKEFDVFLKKLKQGDFKGQRVGQAFYNHFKLHKLKDQVFLDNIYAKDGKHAINSILTLITFS